MAGVAAIVIAAKKEESNSPRLDEVGRYTAGSCTVTAIRDQELHMLEVSVYTGSGYYKYTHWVNVFPFFYIIFSKNN